MSRPFMGTAPRGASVTSGTVSTFAQITAGHVILNGVTFPVIPAVANAAARVDQMVAMINSHYTLTGVWAEKVTATTYKLCASVTIAATLGASATVASCGFATSISQAVSGAVILAAGNRKAHGSGSSSDDSAVVGFGSQQINVKHAKAMGIMDRVNGVDIELTPPVAPTKS